MVRTLQESADKILCFASARDWQLHDFLQGYPPDFTKSQKNKAIVEITLPTDANIHASEYQLYLPSKEELQRKLIEWGNEAGGGK